MPPQRRLPQRRGPYKRYLRDPNAELPRTSCWLRQQEQRELNDNIPIAEQLEENLPEGTQDADTTSIPSDSEVHVLSDEETDRNLDSDSSGNDGSNSDASSITSSSDVEEDLQRNEYSEDDDDGFLGDDGSVSDNEADLHFGDRGNLLNPDILNWEHWNNNENQGGDRQPLYEGAQISQQESDILIMSFIIRWGLEEKGIEHLLRLIDCHMPTALLGSKYSFLKKFETGPSMKTRYFCRECTDMLPHELEGDVECKCGFKCNVEDLRGEVNCFVQLSISEQVQQILNNQDLVRQMRKECAESDVVSGKVYKRMQAGGLIGEDDITLQWNTDGVKPFKSSKVTMYPIQACINELPPLVRRDNMLLCGLYYGMTKPDINAIFKPFVDELKALHLVGIKCNIAGRGERLVKVHTLVCSVDSVARAMLQGIMQFNGQFGCSFCLRQGSRVERGRGVARVFIGGHVGLLRNAEQHLQALRCLERYNETHNKAKTHVQGVKKVSILMMLPVFNIIKSFVPDYMHSALEGVVVTFWKHWCSSEYEGQLWHLSKAKRRLLNEKLQAVMPPDEVTRVPRSLDDIALWKASEMKSFLLYYSLPCLKDLLPNRYLRHWLLLVYSMTVFLRENIGRDDFFKAQQAIVKFVDDISVLYPNCHSLYTFNTHLLLHFPKAVENFGGLWSSSTFSYKHFNGVLTRLIRGTQSVPMQICRSFVRLRRVSHLSSIVFSRRDSPQKGKLLYESMLSKYTCANSYSYSDGLRLFGSPEMYTLSLVEKVSVERLLGRAIDICAKSYRRMILRGTVFHSSVYGALTVRDNSIAKINDGMLVSISRILLIKVANSMEIFCVTLCNLLRSFNEEICRDNDLDISSSHIVNMCRRSERIVSVLPQNIQSKCVVVPYSNAICVIPIVNSTERD